LRIADFERRVAEERMNAGSDNHHMGRAEVSQMLQMLINTLDAMKARKKSLELQSKSPDGQGSPARSLIGPLSAT
jgi:hypothetical protein